MLAAVLGPFSLPGTAQETSAPPASLLSLPDLWEQDDGTTVRLDHWLGQPVLVTMDCSDTCSYTMFRLRQLVRTAQARGEPVEVIVVGYNPKVDDARAWARFRRRRGLSDPHWHFLAGSEPATRALAALLNQHYWFMEEHVQHDFGITLFDSAGRIDRAIGWENRNDDLMAPRATATSTAISTAISTAQPDLPSAAAPLAEAAALEAAAAGPAAAAAAPVDASAPVRARSLAGFVDDLGRPVAPDAGHGALRLVAFGYTSCPDVCPLTLLAIHDALVALGTKATELDASFVTVDPQRDSVERLHAYVSAFDPRIRGYRGGDEDLARYARALGVRYGRETRDAAATDYPMSHTSTVFLLRADAAIAARIDGSLDPQQLTAAIVAAVREAGQPVRGARR